MTWDGHSFGYTQGEGVMNQDCMNNGQQGMFLLATRKLRSQRRTPVAEYTDRRDIVRIFPITVVQYKEMHNQKENITRSQATFDVAGQAIRAGP